MDWPRSLVCKEVEGEKDDHRDARVSWSVAHSKGSFPYHFIVVFLEANNYSMYFFRPLSEPSD